MEAGVGIPERSLDFTFGFDDVKYSDRTLLIEIVDNAETDDNRSHSVTSVKRRRHDHLLTTATTAPRLKTKTIHINSLILAARSPFFRKLFSNGMRESEQKHVTLRIHTLEEVPLMDLLKYVYSNKLPTTLYALLNLLLMADKFEVASCLRDCRGSLQNFPMTCESASVYLDLPPSLQMSPEVEPLIDAAKQLLVENFNDLDKFKEEVLNLPLLGIQAVISRDDLQVTSECAVYDFVLTWARKHYSDLEERRVILKTHLLHLIRFPFMTTTKLIEEVQNCTDIDPEVASKIVIRSLGFKAETPHRKRCLAAEEDSAASRQFVERAYKHRPIKLVEFALPHQQCIIYLDLTREEVMHILHDGEIRSESFYFGGLSFSLITRFYVRNQRMFRLGLINYEVGGSGARTVNYEVSLRRKPSREFEGWVKRNYMVCEVSGSINMFHGLPCTELIGDDSRYFINDVLHVRVMLTIKE